MKGCTYRCGSKDVPGCGYTWKDYRIQKDENGIYRKQTGPGDTRCPKCKGQIVTWTNYEHFAKWYRKQKFDSGCGGG